jgi:hypothetical protein
MSIVMSKIQVPDQTFWATRKTRLCPITGFREMTELRLQYRVDGELFTADGTLLYGTLTIDARYDKVTNQVGGIALGFESGTPSTPVAPSHGGAMPKVIKIPDAKGNIIETVALDVSGYPVPDDDPNCLMPMSHWMVERLIAIHRGMGFALTGITVTPKKNPHTGEPVHTIDKDTKACTQWVYVNSNATDPQAALVSRPRMAAASPHMISGAAGTGARVVRFV